MIKITIGMQFVSKWDGYAISMRVVNVRGSLITVEDSDGKQYNKRPGIKGDGKPYFNDGGHCYRLEATDFCAAEHNRLKL